MTASRSFASIFGFARIATLLFHGPLSDGKNLARVPLVYAMSKDEVSLATVPGVARSAHLRPVEPMRTSEILIALAVVGAISILLSAGILLGRVQQRRNARGRNKAGSANPRTGSRGAPPRQRNLRLVKRR
jgi:hypothetical protein